MIIWKEVRRMALKKKNINKKNIKKKNKKNNNVKNESGKKELRQPGQRCGKIDLRHFESYCGKKRYS